MAPGHLFSLYRDVRDEEVCIAIIRIDKARHMDGSVQCVPTWISAGHLADLNNDFRLAEQLSVRREIPENMVQIRNEP